MRTSQNLSFLNICSNIGNSFLLSPIPLATTNSADWKIKTQNELSPETLRGITKISLMCIALIFLKKWIVAASTYVQLFKYIIFPRDAFQAGFAFNAEFLVLEPTYIIWLVSIGSFLYAALMIFIYITPSVLIYRLMGFEVKTPVYNLFKSKTLYEFFENFNHNYNKIIVEAFVLPILGVMNNKKTNKNTVIIVFLFSITLCGIIYHFFKKPELFMSSNNISVFVLFLASPAVYWVLLSITACGSMALERGEREPRSEYHFFRWFFYLLINSAIFIWVVNYDFTWVTFGMRMRIFLKLFGLE